MLNHNLTHDDVLVSYGRYSESICVKYKNKCNKYPFRFDRRRSGNVLCERTVSAAAVWTVSIETSSVPVSI